MNKLKSLVGFIRKILGNNTELAHGLVALLLFLALFKINLGAAIAAPISGYFFQEKRDETNKILKEEGGSYWYQWIKAIPRAVTKGDFLVPLGVTLAATAVVLLI